MATRYNTLANGLFAGALLMLLELVGGPIGAVARAVLLVLILPFKLLFGV